MKKKICNKCGINQLLINYNKDKGLKDGYKNICIACAKLTKKLYRENNKAKIDEYKKDYKEKNSDKIKLHSKEYYIQNKDKINISKLPYMRKRYHENKNKILAYQSEYNKNNRDKINKYQSKWRLENKEYMLEWGRNYLNTRRANDPLFKLKCSIRIITARSLRNNGYKKDSRTEDILGLSFEDFFIYIESQFESWMTWENRGLYNGELNYGWDIDHIIPLSRATTEAEILELCKYTNLQPLCSKINRDIKKAN